MSFRAAIVILSAAYVVLTFFGLDKPRPSMVPHVQGFVQFLIALGLMIASYAIQSILTPKPEVPKPSSLQDFDFPQVEESTPQPVIFGDVWTPDWIVLWYGDLRTSPIRSSGGKK